MYFLFVRTCILYLAMRLLLADGYSFYINWIGKQCGNPLIANMGSCIMTKYTRGSIVNSVSGDSKYRLQSILNLIAILGSILCFMFFRKQHYESYIMQDLSEQSQDDYSLFVKNIPVAIFDKSQSRPDY